MDYKDTLLTPKTNFEMRANLAKKEPIIQQEWSSKQIYNKLLKTNKNNKEFILHDGPPYANGNLHIGHALNKILKDFIIRHNNNLGHYSPFICGWDTHGLPIENAILKNKKINVKNLDTYAIRKLCKEYALGQTKNQIEQFSRLGIFSDFSTKYLTLEKDYQIQQLELFKLMYKNNLIYRDMKPVYWSPSSKTALAEAEIEYKNLTSSSIYVAFSVVEGNEKIIKDTNIVIWTTTPWTLPANLLLAVSKDIEYTLFEYEKKKYIVATELLTDFCEKTRFNNIKVIDHFFGTKLLNILTKHPLYNRNSKIVEGHHVTVSAGTGIVHIAPGFGEDDYLIAKKNKTEIFVPINDYGKFNKDVNDPDLENVFYEKANDIIIEKLKNNKSLLHLEYYDHQYPVDWRTKKPVIFRATKQWFVSVKKIKKDLLSEIEKVNWKQSWAKNNMTKMIENRNDWCISRQRSWGVPIIAFYNENDKLEISEEIINHIIKLFKENGLEIWYQWETDELLPKKYQNLNWKKETDIMDVWFDSGSSNLYLKSNFNINIPVDLYLEGRDQFRGWFNSSLITSKIKFNKAPYKTLLTHGFITDEKGYKMSKSANNGLDLAKICNLYGSDILRLWVNSVDFGDDVRFGTNILKQIADSYRKIRNTIRFILGNLNDFDFGKNKQKVLSEVDDYVLYETKLYKNKIKRLFSQYNFNAQYLLTMNYISNTLSSFYLDFIKDILYVEKVDSKRRRQVQTTLFYILETLIDTLKPIIPHTMEEVYTHFNKANKKESVILEKWKDINNEYDDEFINKWKKAMKFRNDINKALEIARENKIVKKSLETKITVYLKDDFKMIKNIERMHQILITSELLFADSFENIKDEYDSSFIKVELKQGKKCVRCWMIVNELKNNEICYNCFENVKK